jgi:hypothetical protein
MNGDGNLDIVLGYIGGTGAAIFLGDGKGNFTTGANLPGPVGSSVGINTVADLNGDGILDVAELGGTVAVFTGKGGGTYDAPVNFGGGPFPSYPLAAPLRGYSVANHLLDLILPDSSGGVTVLFNVTK